VLGQLPSGGFTKLKLADGTAVFLSRDTTNTFRPLPPFFPRGCGFEDYIYRLWVRQDGPVRLGSLWTRPRTHTKVQLHAEPRWPPRLFNEEVLQTCSSGRSRDTPHAHGRPDHRVRLCWGEVTAGRMRSRGLDKGCDDCTTEPLEGGREGHEAGSEPEASRRPCGCSPRNLQKAFYAFEPDFFQQKPAEDRGRPVVDRDQGIDRNCGRHTGRDLLLPEKTAGVCLR